MNSSEQSNHRHVQKHQQRTSFSNGQQQESRRLQQEETNAAYQSFPSVRKRMAKAKNALFRANDDLDSCGSASSSDDEHEASVLTSRSMSLLDQDDDSSSDEEDEANHDINNDNSNNSNNAAMLSLSRTPLASLSKSFVRTPNSILGRDENNKLRHELSATPSTTRMSFSSSSMVSISLPSTTRNNDNASLAASIHSNNSTKWSTALSGHASTTGSMASQRIKRRRTVATDRTAASWQDVCRQGTRFKTLLETTVQRVVASEQANLQDNGAPSSPTMMTNSSKSFLPSWSSPTPNFKTRSDAALAAVARQKTADCSRLQQQLELAQSQSSALEAAHAELRSAAAATEARLDSTTQALRQAGKQAAQAREDAEQAEAHAVTWSNQLHALHVVVDETKRASHVLYKEHQEVTTAAKSVEQRVVRMQAAMDRSQQQRKLLEGQKQELQTKTAELQQTNQRLGVELQQSKTESAQWKHSYEKSHALEQSHSKRIGRLETDLHQAQMELVQATEVVAETKRTSASLQDQVVSLEQKNSELHDRVKDQDTKFQSHQENWSKELQHAQSMAQTYQLELQDQKDHLHKLTMERDMNKQSIVQLKGRIQEMEQQKLQSSGALMTPPPANKQGGESNRKSMNIPPLLSASKENCENQNVQCSICFQAAMGIPMKRCQCGRSSCTMQAHGACIRTISIGPSVSHPCTPAPALPVVLCCDIIASGRKLLKPTRTLGKGNKTPISKMPSLPSK